MADDVVILSSYWLTAAAQSAQAVVCSTTEGTFCLSPDGRRGEQSKMSGSHPQEWRRCVRLMLVSSLLSSLVGQLQVINSGKSFRWHFMTHSESCSSSQDGQLQSRSVTNVLRNVTYTCMYVTYCNDNTCMCFFVSYYYFIYYGPVCLKSSWIKCVCWLWRNCNLTKTPKCYAH